MVMAKSDSGQPTLRELRLDTQIGPTGPDLLTNRSEAQELADNFATRNNDKMTGGVTDWKGYIEWKD